MIFILIVIIIALFIYQLFLMNKINKTRREMGGLPIATPFPQHQRLPSSQKRNPIVVVSTTCTVCQRLFKEYNHKTHGDKLTFAFVDDTSTVTQFLKQHPHMSSASVVSFYDRDQLFVKNTPLAYILNSDGYVVDKQSIVSLKELPINS